MDKGKVQRPVLSRLFVGGQRRVYGYSSARILVFAILFGLFAMACGLANGLQMTATTANTPFATPEPTANVVCTALRGAVTIRNADGRAVGWLEAGTPVCVVPERIGDRLQLADGTANTILAACVYGPTERCK